MLFQYKDAFLSANPNFRWYKLPAPPLRTLTTRPTYTKNLTPLSSPTSPLTSEFNLGKLADESQLGGLTSLMNNNYTGFPKKEEDSIQESGKLLEKADTSLLNSETDNVNASTPPKPIKKRFVEPFNDSKCLSYSFGDIEMREIDEADQEDASNLTKQDLMNKVSTYTHVKFFSITYLFHFVKLVI